MIYTINILKRASDEDYGIEKRDTTLSNIIFHIKTIGTAENVKEVPFLWGNAITIKNGNKQTVQLLKEGISEENYNFIKLNCFNDIGISDLYTVFNGKEFYLYNNPYLFEISKPKLYLPLPPLIRQSVKLSAKSSQLKDNLGHTKSAYERAIGYYDSSEKPPSGGKGRLESLTVKELQQRCMKRHIPYSGKRKAELIELLRK